MTEAVLTPVTCTVEIDAPRERVFEAHEHGRIRLEFEGRGDVSGTVTTYDPPRAVGFTWVRGVAPDIVTQVDVAFSELDDGGTRVELRHTGWQAVPDEQVAEWRAIHGAGWNHFLGCLRDLAEGRPVDKTFG